jgi:hypothetical protein
VGTNKIPRIRSRNNLLTRIEDNTNDNLPAVKVLTVVILPAVKVLTVVILPAVKVLTVVMIDILYCTLVNLNLRNFA